MCLIGMFNCNNNQVYAFIAFSTIEIPTIETSTMYPPQKPLLPVISLVLTKKSENITDTLIIQ
jgi:hypothetical protein